MKSFHRRIRREIEVFEHAYSVEPNPKDTGAHTHGWVHGSSIDIGAVQDAAIHAGMGSDVHLEAAYVPGGNDPMLDYGLKLLSRQNAVESKHSSAAADFLRLNGNRPISTTENFWRDGAVNEPLPDRRSAVRLSRERAGLLGTYAIVTTGEAQHGNG